MAKGQKTTKFNKRIQAKKTETSRAKNLDIGQSGIFFTSGAKKAFTKLT